MVYNVPANAEMNRGDVLSWIELKQFAKRQPDASVIG